MLYLIRQTPKNSSLLYDKFGPLFCKKGVQPPKNSNVSLANLSLGTL